MDSSKSWNTFKLPEQTWNTREKWNNSIQERLPWPGEILRLSWSLIEKRSFILPAHQHTSLLHPTVLLNTSLRGQTMDAISCLEGAPGISRGGPMGDTTGVPDPSLRYHPYEGTAIPKWCIYFLVSPLTVFCEIKKLNWWIPGLPQGKSGKMSPEPADPCWHWPMSL